MEKYFKGSLSPLPSVHPVSYLLICELLIVVLFRKCPMAIKYERIPTPFSLEWISYLKDNCVRMICLVLCDSPGLFLGFFQSFGEVLTQIVYCLVKGPEL